MVKIENVLQCDICRNNFDMNKHRPLVAKCGHTFCKHCILCNHQNKNCSSCPIDKIQYMLNIESCIPNIKLEEVIKIIFNIDSPKLKEKQIVYSKPEILRNKTKSKTKKLSSNQISFHQKLISFDKTKMKITNLNKFSTEYKFVHTEPNLISNTNSNVIANKMSFDDEKTNNDNINETLDAIPIKEEKSLLNVSFKDEMNSLFKKNTFKISKNFQSKDNKKDDNDLIDSFDKISKIDDEFINCNNTNNDFSILSNKNLFSTQTKNLQNENENENEINNNYEQEKIEKLKKYTKNININLNLLKRNNSSQDNLKKISSNSDRETDSNSNGKEKIEISPKNIQNIKISLINSNENMDINSKTIDINNNSEKIERNIFKSQLINKDNEKIFENKNEEKILINNNNLKPSTNLYKHHLITSQSTKIGNSLIHSYTTNVNFSNLNNNNSNNNFNKYSTNTANQKATFQIDEEDDEIIDNTSSINTISSIKSKQKLVINQNNEEIEDDNEIIKEKQLVSLQHKFPQTPKDKKIIDMRFPIQNKSKNLNFHNPKEETHQKLINQILYFCGYNGTLLSKRKIEQTTQYQKYLQYINSSLSKKIFKDNYNQITIKLFQTNDIFIGYINKNNLPKKGIFYYNNGDYYEGELINGIREGFGYMKLKNGTIYEGDFKNNKHDGYGKLTQIDGEVFSGKWKDGKIDGKGIRYHNNGDKYIGNYSNNLKEGYGKYFFSNGNIYEGNWENGKANGLGKFIFNDGNVYEGEFKDNIICGKGTFIMKNGDKYFGNFKNGFINGRGVCENNKGEKYSGFFSKGKKHGMGKLFDSKGNIIASGYWNMDKYVGKVSSSNDIFM